MFDAVAPTYELVNTLTSFGRDAYWRRRAVELARISAEDRVLDVACGTGNLARAFTAARPKPATVVGTDFSRGMLGLTPGSPNGRIRYCEADALLLPFADREPGCGPGPDAPRIGSRREGSHPGILLT